jgi:cobalt-zinc-cadmium resistance protein CzcA
VIETRSFSRYGLSQVTVVFKDGTDIYFARQRVSERLQDVLGRLPADIHPELGPIATALGEVFKWTVEAKPGARKPDGKPYDCHRPARHPGLDHSAPAGEHPGVTEVSSHGGFRRQFHVTPDPSRSWRTASRSRRDPGNSRQQRSAGAGSSSSTGSST